MAIFICSFFTLSMKCGSQCRKANRYSIEYLLSKKTSAEICKFIEHLLGNVFLVLLQRGFVVASHKSKKTKNNFSFIRTLQLRLKGIEINR